jgi:hypothetical protein
MRKRFRMALCAVALASAGTWAAIETQALAPLAPNGSAPLSERLAQAVQALRGTPVEAIVAPFGNTERSRSLSRSAPAATATPASAQDDDGETSYVVVLAGLLIMGVIIKRRYGKGV